MKLGIFVTVLMIGMACLGAIPRSKFVEGVICYNLALDPVGCVMRAMLGGVDDFTFEEQNL